MIDRWIDLLSSDFRQRYIMLQVQMFVSVLAMVATTLAAIVHDRKQMEGELNEMNYTLESQVKMRTITWYCAF
jgi:hypothetical protein